MLLQELVEIAILPLSYALQNATQSRWIVIVGSTVMTKLSRVIVRMIFFLFA